MLKSHHHVHPVRRRVGLAVLVIIVVALLAASWRQNHLADSIEASVRRWIEQQQPQDDPGAADANPATP